MIEIDEEILNETCLLLRVLESLCKVLPAQKRAAHLADRARRLRERIECELAEGLARANPAA